MYEVKSCGCGMWRKQTESIVTPDQGDLIMEINNTVCKLIQPKANFYIS